MPFVEIGRKPVLKRDVFPDCVYVSDRWLKFSGEFWKAQLGSAPAVRLFFNEETSQVGLVPCHDHGYKVLLRKGCAVPTVNWRSFILRARLSFEKFTYFKVENLGANDTMRTFCVIGGKNG